MIKLGEIQELEVVKKMDFGVYLKSSDDQKGDDRILLPIKQVPVDTEIGDKISVFVYRDSNDRIIATVNRPKIVIGEIGFLKVVEMSKIGAFLNWGLEKDLFLPFKEQIGELRNSGEYMVGLYVDKSDRLCATMNLFKVLRTDSPFKINDVVKGTVFSLKRGLGAMVAVEGKYLGLIHEGEILKPLKSGDEVEVRVSNIKEDGKLDLSLKDAPKLQIDRDGDRIFSALAKNKGRLPINDNSDPKLINDMLGMSKGSFKKGVGRLMKKGMIEITREGIKLAEKKERPVNSFDYDDYRKSDQRGGSSRNNNNRSNDKKGYSNNRSSDNRNNDSKNSNYKGNDNRNTDSRNSNYKGNDNRNTDSRNSNYKGNDNRNSDSRNSNYKGNDNRNTDSRNSNYKSNDNRNTGNKNNSYKGNSNYKGNSDKKNNSDSRNNGNNGNNEGYKSNSSNNSYKGKREYKGSNSSDFKKR